MKNTYINDQDLVNYPFAEGQTLPFPRHAVSSISIGYRYKDYVANRTFTINYITVTGVEIGNNQITLAITANDSVYIGRMTAESGRAGTLVTELDGVAFNMLFEAGNLKDIEPLSVACSLALDPSCVVYQTLLHYDSYMHEMIINGEVYPIGECLDIHIDGALSTEFTHTDSWGNYYFYTVYVVISGWLEAGAGSFITSQLGTYDMVTSINGVDVRGAGEENRPILMFKVVPLSTEPSSTLTMDRLKFGIVNGLTPDQITDDSEQEGPNKVLVGFNDTMGNATTLTVIGGDEIPNCYGNLDQSAHPDDPTINALPTT